MPPPNVASASQLSLPAITSQNLGDAELMRLIRQRFPNAGHLLDQIEGSTNKEEHGMVIQY